MCVTTRPGFSNTSNRESRWYRTLNRLSDASGLFQKYFRRKGRTTVDCAGISGRRIEAVSLFPKFELLEHTFASHEKFVTLSSSCSALLSKYAQRKCV